MARRINALVFLSLLASVAIGWDYGKSGLDWTSLGSCGGSSESIITSQTITNSSSSSSTDVITAIPATTHNATSKPSVGDSQAVQSPVDLNESSMSAGGKKAFFKYPRFGSDLVFYNNGRALAFTLPESYRAGFGLASSASELTSENAESYRLWQVSLHSPSEHTIGGVRFPLEMQLVHQRVTGDPQLAIVSVLFHSSAVSPRNALLDFLMSAGDLPRRPWQEIHLPPDRTGIDLGTSLQKTLVGSDFISYNGSLTIPPCDTGVQHLVRKATVSALSGQLDAFRQVLQAIAPPYGNFRMIQPHTSSQQIAFESYEAVDHFAEEATATGKSASTSQSRTTSPSGVNKTQGVSNGTSTSATTPCSGVSKPVVIVSLPRGASANPFGPYAADTIVRIGAGESLAPRGVTKLTPNLRQYDAPGNELALPVQSGNASGNVAPCLAAGNATDRASTSAETTNKNVSIDAHPIMGNDTATSTRNTTHTMASNTTHNGSGNTTYKVVTGNATVNGTGNTTHNVVGNNSTVVILALPSQASLVASQRLQPHPGRRLRASAKLNNFLGVSR